MLKGSCPGEESSAQLSKRTSRSQYAKEHRDSNQAPAPFGSPSKSRSLGIVNKENDAEKLLKGFCALPRDHSGLPGFAVESQAVPNGQSLGPGPAVLGMDSPER